MSETETDPVITQAVDQLLGGSRDAQLKHDLQAEAQEAFKPGISAEDLAKAIHEARISTAGNSDPRTWPGVAEQRVAPGDAVEATLTQPNEQLRPDADAEVQPKTDTKATAKTAKSPSPGA